MAEIVVENLARFALRHFQINPHGTHGLGHWSRVHKFGLALANITGADTNLVTYFAYFHDIMRNNEGEDYSHGRKSADFIRKSKEAQKLIDLDKEQQTDLLYAIECHSDGLVEANVNVQTCWDSDRLDLFKVGIPRRYIRFCTQAAQGKELLDWAEKVSSTRG